MQEKNEDHVVVIDSKAHKIPIGVVTEHEICLQVVGRGRSPRGMTAANVMNTDFVKADANSELSDYRREMRDGRRVIVVDDNGSLRGVLPRNIPEESSPQSIPERLFKNVLPASRAVMFDRIF
jgi:CBS domain-containing protein